MIFNRISEVFFQEVGAKLSKDCIHKEFPMVNFFFKQWKDILNSVLQAFILSQILCNIFMNEESGTEHTYIYSIYGQHQPESDFNGLEGQN